MKVEIMLAYRHTIIEDIPEESRKAIEAMKFPIEADEFLKVLGHPKPEMYRIYVDGCQIIEETGTKLVD